MTATIESGDVAEIPIERETPSTPRERWLARRGGAWGASETPVLLAARGLIDVERCPAYLRAELEVGRWGVPRYLAAKAGLAGRKRTGAAAKRGTERECELLATWVQLVVHGQVPEAGVDPATVRHADALPLEWQPIRDPECDALAATPDGWARGILEGELVVIELKCSVGGKREERSLAEVPHWEAQVHAQLAALSAEVGLLVIGHGWARDRGDGIDGPIYTHVIERDEQRIAQIREVCESEWAEVERLRARRQ